MQAISETGPHGASVVVAQLHQPRLIPPYLDFIWEKFGAHMELDVDPLKKHRGPEPQKDLLTIHPEVLSNR